MLGEREDATLSAWAAIVWKHKWLLLVFTGLALATTVVFTRQQPRIYEASTEIIIDLAAPRYLAGGSGEVISLGTGNSWNTREFFETQYRIIKSRSVASIVVDRMGLGHDLDFLGITRIEDEAERAEALARTDPVSVLVRRLSVDPIADSRNVLIKVRDHDPARAARIADAVADAYADRNLKLKVDTAGDAATWLRTQASDLESQVAGAEARLLAFKREHAILGSTLAEQQHLAGLEVQDARRQLRQRESETADIGARYAQVRRLNVRDAESGIDEVLENGLVQRLKEQRIALQNERRDLLKRYLETHPDVKVLDDKLARVEQALAREVAGIRTAMKRRLAATEQAEAEARRTVERLEAAYQGLQVFEVDYKALETEVDKKKGLQARMLDRITEAELQAQTRTNNVSPLDAALVPHAPVSPRLTVNLAVALVLSMIGGLGLILLVERLDNSVKSQEQVEAYGLTFLGLIPQVLPSGGLFKANGRETDRTDRYVLDNPNSTAAECVRTIRTNLLFMASERELRSMMITSAGPREGKTTTCVNIGATMAMSGSRTLLVDSDLRRPRLHTIFGADNDRGLTNLILDPERPVDGLVRSTGVDDLDLLCSGPLPPNPSELLHTRGFRRALERLLETYDRVIFDSPPVVAVTDAQILGQQVDGTLLVVRAGETRRPMLEKAATLLRTVNVNILGALLNDVDVSRGGYGQYRDYYSADQTSTEVGSESCARPRRRAIPGRIERAPG